MKIAMTHEEVIRLAQELADPEKAPQLTADGEFVVMTPDELVRVAYQLIRDEREACARVCDEYAQANVESDIMVDAFCHCSVAIRARGEKS